VEGARALRRAFVAEDVAVPDRDERLPRHARRYPPRPPDRRRPAGGRRRRAGHAPADARAIPADADPAEAALLRESIRLAFVAALQHLPPKQRAALLLTEVLGWSVAEVAAALETSIASINSALQRARATLAARQVGLEAPREAKAVDLALVERYVDAFQRYDIDALAALLRDDAIMSMPPYTLWLQGPDSIRSFMLGRGAGCRGSRLVAAPACGQPAFGQYKLGDDGVHRAWGLVVLEVAGDHIASLTTFLDTERIFPRFGLPLELR
jgi:RNA polymerase sigma-70 factor, ECF subfamily